jgi:hypothetical protein
MASVVVPEEACKPLDMGDSTSLPDEVHLVYGDKDPVAAVPSPLLFDI